MTSRKQDQFDQPGSLMLKTIELMKDKDLFQLHSETKISYYWLKKFVAGSFRNPSCNRVEFLYEHLTNTSLL